MKREDLEKLGLSKEQVDAIMTENGKDIESQKTKTTAAEQSATALQKQLEEANKAIEGFKGLDVEGIKKGADEWKSKYEQAQKDAAEQLARLKFDHALDSALAGAKARNVKAVRALLDMDIMKLTDTGEVSGLKEQLEKIKADNDYLFESDTHKPQVTAGGQTKSNTPGDSFMNAAMKAMGISADMLKEGK